MSHVWVKLRHQEIHVDQVVELPAFTDQRVAQDITQADCVGIGSVVGANTGKTKWRCEGARRLE